MLGIIQPMRTIFTVVLYNQNHPEIYTLRKQLTVTNDSYQIPRCHHCPSHSIIDGLVVVCQPEHNHGTPFHFASLLWAWQLILVMTEPSGLELAYDDTLLSWTLISLCGITSPLSNTAFAVLASPPHISVKCQSIGSKGFLRSPE